MTFATNVGCGTLSKLILQIWLLGLFLHFFGLPALRRYNEQKVIVVKMNGQLRGRRRTLLDAQNNQSGTKRGAGAWEGNMKSRIEQNTHFFGDGLGEFLVFKHN